jgi:hypothetical protein
LRSTPFGQLVLFSRFRFRRRKEGCRQHVSGVAGIGQVFVNARQTLLLDLVRVGVRRI